MVTSFVDEINKKYQKQLGKDVIFNADDDRFKIDRIPTGVLSIDCLTGGGFPIGRWTEIYGDESLLKTSLAMMAMAEAQRMGYAVMYCNVERNVSKDLFELRGVDTSPEKLFIMHTDVAEDYINTVRDAMKKNLFKVIVMDSISALFPRREAEGKKDEQVGAAGLMTSRMGRVLTASNDNSTAFILINQTRQKIGGFGFGDPTTRSGGKAPRFYDSMTLRLTRIGGKKEVKKDRVKTGRGYRHLKNIEIACELEKTKVSGSFMGDETVMLFDVENNRIDDVSEILAHGSRCGKIKLVGRSVIYKGNRIPLEDFKRRLEAKPKLVSLLKRDILKEIIGG